MELGKTPDIGIRYRCTFNILLLSKSSNLTEICSHMKSLSCTEAVKSLPPVHIWHPVGQTSLAVVSVGWLRVSALVWPRVSRLCFWVTLTTWSPPQTILSAPLDKSAREQREHLRWPERPAQNELRFGLRTPPQNLRGCET